jgi:hypothetical protein
MSRMSTEITAINFALARGAPVVGQGLRRLSEQSAKNSSLIVFCGVIAAG